MLTPNDTHETARTQFIDGGDVRFAYRRFGRGRGFPLLLLNYFAANMDDWDPKVTNGLAADHDVVLFDNAGVGSSTGETPSNVSAMTRDFVKFCRALDLKKFNVMGFSLGGMIAQELAFEYPDMVGRIILLATGPRGGEGMTFTELSLERVGRPSGASHDLVFYTARGQHGCGTRLCQPIEASRHGSGRAGINEISRRSVGGDPRMGCRTLERPVRHVG